MSSKISSIQHLIKMVVFDMAGTTVYDDDFVNLAFQRALREGSSLEVTRKEINDVMGMRKPDAIRQVLQTRRGPGSAVSDEEVDGLHRLFLRTMLDFYARDPQVRPIDGAAEAFVALREGGIRVALDTGFSRDIAQVIVDRLGWRGLIDDMIASDEVAQGRPAPLMIQKLMERAGISDPKEVAKCGDTPVDLLEGFNAGCSVNVGVLSGACKREELESHPHTHLLDSIIDVVPILLSSRIQK